MYMLTELNLLAANTKCLTSNTGKNLFRELLILVFYP